MGARNSLVKGHITWINNGVSLKVINSIRSVMRGVPKQNAIKRVRLKLIKIAILQNKAFASKRPKMRDRRLATKAKLKGSQV
jgi:hypothetical protein